MNINEKLVKKWSYDFMLSELFFKKKKILSLIMPHFYIRQLTNPAQKISLFTETAQIFQLITTTAFQVLQ